MIKLMKSSIVSIKNIEIDRLVVSGKKRLENKNKVINLVDDEEERLDAILSHVCRNWNEDMQDQEYDHILNDLSPFPRQEKSNLAKMNKTSTGGALRCVSLKRRGKNEKKWKAYVDHVNSDWTRINSPATMPECLRGQGFIPPWRSNILLAYLPKNQKPVQTVSPMKRVFWNSRGLPRLAKHRYLAHMFREEQINFLCTLVNISWTFVVIVT